MTNWKDLNPYDLIGIPKNLILYAGTLTTNKGIGLLVKIIKKVLAKRDDACFVICGAGSEEYVLVDLIEENKVAYMGKVRPEYMGEVYDNIDFVLMPSVWGEPFGRIPMEAGVMGKVTIGTAGGGIKDQIIDGKTGFLIDPPNNIKQWVEKIEFLLDNPKKRMEMGAAMRKRVKEKYGKTVIKQIIDVYRSVLSK